MQLKSGHAPFLALLAAALYALSTPFSKLLLEHVSSAMLAALLYLGAGAGLLAVRIVHPRAALRGKEQPLVREDLPYTAAMVLLDIAAPVCMMFGLRAASAANVSLLNNFEIVATSLIALLLFREAVSARLWLAIGLITAASMLLCFEGADSLRFSSGSVLVLLACVCWGFENNCTRKLSAKDPVEIVIVKGFGSGLGALALAFGVGERLPQIRDLLWALLLGFAAYGLSILFYIYAQRAIGAAKTSVYYACAPFLSAGLSLLLHAGAPSVSFLASLAVMALGVYFASSGQK